MSESSYPLLFFAIGLSLLAVYTYSLLKRTNDQWWSAYHHHMQKRAIQVERTPEWDQQTNRRRTRNTYGLVVIIICSAALWIIVLFIV